MRIDFQPQIQYELENLADKYHISPSELMSLLVKREFAELEESRSASSETNWSR